MDPLGVIFNICVEIRTEWWRSSESKNNADITTFPRLQLQYYLKTSGILTISPSFARSLTQGILSIFPSIFREYFAVCLVNVVILPQYVLGFLAFSVNLQSHFKMFLVQMDAPKRVYMYVLQRSSQ